jgi:hypothetical protein
MLVRHTGYSPRWYASMSALRTYQVDRSGLRAALHNWRSRTDAANGAGKQTAVLGFDRGEETPMPIKATGIPTTKSQPRK